MLKLIKNAEVFTPYKAGIQDILICGDKVEEIAPSINCSYQGMQIIDAGAMTAIPGLIDQHVHIIGGGGEGGFASSIGRISVESCVKAGVTTVVGLLGTDSTSKDVRSLLAYTKAMNDLGLTAFCLTGAYAYPSPTITGSVLEDMAYISEIIGVKIALSDNRSSYPTKDELLRLASEVRVGALLSKKRGIVHIHLGREKRGLEDIIDIVKTSDMPIAHFKPTHVKNQLTGAYEFASLGGSIDFSTGSDLDETASLIAKALGEIDPKRITVSTDANGSLPVWDKDYHLIGMKKGEISSLFETIRILVRKHGLPLEKALPLVTENVAEGLGLSERKGCIKAGAGADIVLLDEAMQVKTVFSKGKELLKDGAICFSPFYRE